MSTFENLLVDRDGGITRITVNRPKVLNALNRATLLELNAALDQVEEAGDVRAVVLTGAGEKAFVAGADIAEMAALGAPAAAEFSRLGHRVMNRLDGLDAIVIAAVNGFALGGGLELVLACDFAIAAENARLGLPEVKLGVMPGFGGTIRLARRVGVARARQLIATGEPITAQAAERFGLVNEVVPQDRLLGRVEEITSAVAKNAPRAVAWAKRSTRISAETDFNTAAAYEQELFGMCFATEDQTEGMSAFLEKRPAVWKGR